MPLTRWHRDLRKDVWQSVLAPGTVIINRYHTPHLNKLFRSYFLVFGKCRVTLRRLYRGSLTLKIMIIIKLVQLN